MYTAYFIKILTEVIYIYRQTPSSNSKRTARQAITSKRTNAYFS